MDGWNNAVLSDSIIHPTPNHLPTSQQAYQPRANISQSESPGW